MDMGVAVKKKTSSTTPTVRFSPTTAIIDRHGIIKTDGRRTLKTQSESNRDNIYEDKFTLSRTWILSTVVLLCGIIALSYRGYLDTRAVNYPYEGPKVFLLTLFEHRVIQKNSELTLWGTYRPGAYFGLRTKEPLGKGSVAAGLMWYTQHNLMRTGSIDSSIRHMCDNSHENLVYGYVEHDTVNYGHQVINDGKENGFKLQTIFLRPSNNGKTDTPNTDWTTRIIYETNNSASSVSLVWYVYIDPGEDEQLLNKEEYSLGILKGVDGILETPLVTIMGSTPSLSDFKMSVIPILPNNTNNISTPTVHINTSISSSWCPNAAMLKQCLAKSMAIRRQPVKDPGISSQIMLVDEKYSIHDNSHQTLNILKNFVALQVTISPNNKKATTSKFRSYTLDVAYTQKNKYINKALFKGVSPLLVGDKFSSVHTEYSNRFKQKFQNTFPIKMKDDTADKLLLLDFAKVTFSNMAGSLGYFYGSSLVRDDDDENNLSNSGVSEIDIVDAVKYWRAGLLTAVPSRSQFPRGFLWDDGFHGLMLGRWSVELQLQILGHWMDLLNHQGWIPREQILGSEARSRVPEEFVVQSSRAANPPTLLLTVDLLLRQIKQRRQAKDNTTSNKEKLNFDEVDNTLKKLYPRLKVWYTWFNRTQKAVNNYTKHLINPNEFHLDKRFIGYRWRGRDAITNKELNPKTLTSGMDDYPRSSHPVNDDGSSNIDSILNNANDFDFDASERHVDLHCWMAHGARIMNNLFNYLQPTSKTNFKNKYSIHFWMLVESLDRLHWAQGNNDTSQTSTSKIPMYADYGIHTDDVRLEKLKGMQDSVRVVGRKSSPKWRFVDSHVGYNALFPMFFRLVKNAQRLNAILDLIEGTNSTGNHSLLTKHCGLRSLSKSSPLYKVRNTMHDPPYWRGSVWINMQYLACSSLYYYANLPEDTKSTYANNDEYENLEPIRYLDVKTKQRCTRLYDKIRNDVIQCVYKEWKRTGYVWEQYDDEPVSDSILGLIHKGKGTRPFTGWSANVVLLMAEIY